MILARDFEQFLLRFVTQLALPEAAPPRREFTRLARDLGVALQVV